MSHQQASNSLLSILFALAANLAICLAKLAAAFYTGSGAMLAEGVHSLADTGNQLLLLVGLKQAKKPPTPDYPLGFGKSIYFWSFIVAVMMFSMGGVFSVYEGIHKFRQPEPLTSPWVALGVLVFSLVAEGVSLWGCMREIGKVRGKRSLFSWFHQSRESELLVVFGEDLAALIGLSFAFLAILTALVTGNPVYDAAGSIAIGVLLILVAILVGAEVKSLLIGQGVDPQIQVEMEAFLDSQPEIRRVFNLITFQLGKDVMVAVKAQMEEFQSQSELIRAINNCEKRFKERFPQVFWSFFEPDDRD
jgi:cation diffusion facilitator family transporter